MPHERHGPTTKAGCLNTLYAALERDEQHCGYHARMVVLHDAEDMVDPAALAVFDRALEHAEFIQLLVLPEVQASSRWVGSHYCDEFAELNCTLSQRSLGRSHDQRGGLAKPEFEVLIGTKGAPAPILNRELSLSSPL